VVFKQQPLSFHKFAQEAAEASLAAHEQGKFWEYHDLLFANQKALDRASLEKYAEQLGLDMAKFKAALDSHKFAEQVKRDQAIAAKVGATGTPTSFVNGNKVRGASPFAAFKSVIDRELAKAARGGSGTRGAAEGATRRAPR
jgi:protein-disulfide isomerase